MEISQGPQSYQGALADLYDLFFTVSPEEYEFYRYFLHLIPGRALEIGCGTGQLLVPYLKEGLTVDGLDSSLPMLTLCRRKAEEKGLQPVLYHQAAETMQLPRAPLYTTIYVPSSTFMLITDRSLAWSALRRWYESLAPGGQLLLSLFIPWYERPEVEDVALLRKKVFLPPHTSVYLYQTMSYKPLEQLRQGIYRFEFTTQARVECVELYEFWWRWYGVHEAHMLLEQADFGQITLYGDYTLEVPHEHTQVVVLRGIKPAQSL
jgi:SAM-dependent methyltransferase